jgi:succinyl-diaminopimelate desuccinylase
MNLNLKVDRRELLAFCQAIVRTPSVNGEHDEKDVADLVVAFAASHGLQVDTVARERSRPNVLVTVGPPGKPGFLLVAHMDTVAVGREDQWTRPPFGGDIDNGRLYGRGAADNKGGLVAALACLLNIQERSHLLRRPVMLVCVPDEESGASGTLGIKYLIEKGRLHISDAIYTYPGMRRVIVGHRGVLRMKLSTHGRAVHSGSRAWQDGMRGSNAVTAMAEILLALEKTRFENKAEHPLFRNYRTVITPGTLINGGTGKSIVPDYCEAAIDVRTVPGVATEEVEREILRISREVAERRGLLSVKVVPDTYLPVSTISPDAPIVSVIQEACQKVTGKRPPVTISGPANESYILNEFGINTCVLGPEGANVHAANEYVVVESIFRAAAVYSEIAEMMLGRSEP